jgi:hypothetical protein
VVPAARAGRNRPVLPKAPATPTAPAARMAERRVTNGPVPELSSRAPDMVTSTCSWASKKRSTKRAKRLPIPHNIMVKSSFRTLPQSYTLAANISISARSICGSPGQTMLRLRNSKRVTDSVTVSRRRRALPDDPRASTRARRRHRCERFSFQHHRPPEIGTVTPVI